MTADVNVPALQARVTKILTDPKTEWPVIEAETTTIDKLYKGYIMPLAAIPAVAQFIGLSFIGLNAGFLGTIRTPLVNGLVRMVVFYALSLATVYAAALVISKLAPTFQSKSDDLQALKLVAYAQTAGWIAGVLAVIPVLGVLAIIGGLYSIYLCYLGLPVMMKTPQDKVIPYLVVSAIVIIVLAIIAGAVTGALVGVSQVPPAVL